MDSADADLLARSTLSHSLALSGLHLSYAAAVGYGAAYALFWCFPTLAVRIPKRQAAVALALIPAIFYTWLGGAPPSLLRAGLMLLFWGLLLLLRRPSVLQDGLLWAVGLILLVDPLALFDIRLQLSALAVASIAMVTPVMSGVCSGISARIMCNGGGWVGRVMARALAASIFMLGISLAVQLVLMPVLVRTFGIYGLAFPLNLLWLPVLGLLVMPAAFCGLAACAFNLTGLAELCFQVAAFPCAKLMEFLHWLEPAGLMPVSLPTRPHWLFILGYWLLLVLVPVCINLRNSRSENPGRGFLKIVPTAISSRENFPAEARLMTRFPAALAALGVLLCLLPLALRHYETSRDTVRLRLLDVGQGQAVLLEWPGGGRLLLDGGGGSSPRFDVGKSIVTATLLDNRPPRLNYMLASHPDLDHMQGLLFPLRHLDVGYFGDNGAFAADAGEEPQADRKTFIRLEELLTEKGMTRHSLYAGQKLELGSELRLDILHPPAPGKIGAAEGGGAGEWLEGFEAPAFQGNNASLVARLVWKEKPLALLCGDAEKPAQRYLLKQFEPAERNRSAPVFFRGPEQPEQPGQTAGHLPDYTEKGPLAAQVLVLPHHGSAGASLPEFYLAVRPELALASCGYGNQWNFPSAATRKSLGDLGIDLLSTSVSGQITVEWSADGKMKVSTARP